LETLKSPRTHPSRQILFQIKTDRPKDLKIAPEARKIVLECNKAEKIGKPYEPKRRAVSEDTLTYEEKMQRDMDQFVIQEMRK
jgi:hypothetical protein